jgi:uncharacterized protein
MGRISWVLLGCLALVPSAHAASFDCAKASTSVEKMVCGDDKLSQLDSELSAAYKQALEAASNKQTLIHEQRQWIHDVRGICADVTCLTRAYTARLREIREPPGLRAAMARYDARQQELRHEAYGAVVQKIDASDYQFNYVLADLDGDGIKDAIVYFTDGCGSGGCAMRVMRGTEDGFTYVSGSTITRVPIYVLPSKTHGWSDIAVTVGGGGVRPGTRVLKFDGHKYPLNPSLAPVVSIDPDQAGIIKLPLHY